MVVSVLPNSVDQKKRKRLAKQARNLAAIQSQPQDLWVDLLFEQWPQSLPVYVISRLIEQGHVDLVEEYGDIIDSRDHFKELERELDCMQHAITEDMAVHVYTALAETNPQVLSSAQDMMAFILSLPQPIHITAVTSDVPLMMAMKSIGKVDHPEEEKMVLQTRPRPNYFVVDGDWNDNMLRHFEGTVVAALVRQGGIQIRHRLALRVQRRNEYGVLEWVHQEKLYGFSLVQGTITPLSAQQFTNARCTEPNGESMPWEAGTHVGHTDKEFAAFAKRRKH